MKSQIECTGRLNVEDVVQMSQAVTFKKTICYGLCIFVLCMMLMIILEPRIKSVDFIANVLISTVASVAGYFSIRIILKIKAKKSFNTNKCLQEEAHYIFSNEGIRISADYGEAFVAWDKYYKVRMTKTHTAFFLSAANQYHLIPLRWLEPEHCVQEFEELLRSNIAPNKIKRL